MTHIQTLNCARHPQRETLLRCSKCERPFCVDCVVPTPVGHRCYECAGVRRVSATATYGRALVLTTAIASGASALQLLGARFGGLLVAVIVGLVAGAAIGRVLDPLVNRRTRIGLLVGGAAALALGGVLGRALIVLLALAAAISQTGQPGVGILGIALRAALSTPLDPSFWLLTGVAAAVAYRRLR